MHKQASPLLIGNAWNPQSARVFEALGFQAIGTSSAAIAHTLGYEDGEQVSFTDLLFIVKKIIRTIRIPLSCHRVIGSNGSLTGYGGGLWRKKYILDLEAKLSNP